MENLFKLHVQIHPVYVQYALSLVLTPQQSTVDCTIRRMSVGAQAQKQTATIVLVWSPLYSVQCTLYTALHAADCLMSTYSVQRILHTAHYKLYTLHWTFYNVHFRVYSVHCSLYTVYCPPFTEHCTLYNVDYKLYTLLCFNPLFFTVYLTI